MLTNNLARRSPQHCCEDQIVSEGSVEEQGCVHRSANVSKRSIFRAAIWQKVIHGVKSHVNQHDNRYWMTSNGGWQRKMAAAFKRPTHHPEEDLLTSYAAGQVTGSRALLVATHLAYCLDCRAVVAAAESVGGELLEGEVGIEPEAQLDPNTGTEPSNTLNTQAGGLRFPRPLRDLIAAGEKDTKWRNIWFGVKELTIPGYGPDARLLWIPAGRRMPRHDHNGEEFTLVLQGSFSDKTGAFLPGDLQLGTPGLDHQPQAGRDMDCICLVVETGGLRLSGWLGRLVGWRSGRSNAKMAA
jgi:putative transcriptional regulator